jgi:hypothetical protein
MSGGLVVGQLLSGVVVGPPLVVVGPKPAGAVVGPPGLVGLPVVGLHIVVRLALFYKLRGNENLRRNSYLATEYIPSGVHGL